MVYRNSKYVYNCWKYPDIDRNLNLFNQTLKLYSVRSILGHISVISFYFYTISFIGNKVFEDNKQKKIFNINKTKNVAHDYLIYSIGKEDTVDNVNNLSDI